MEVEDRTAIVVRFGDFEIDRRACELRRAGRRVPLQIQPFRVLEVLIDHAGRVVTRSDIRAKIWPSTVYVDFDHGLNNAMNRLRHALEDSAESPRFIETLPRVGYRFMHPLEDAEPPPVPTSPMLTKARGAGLGAAAVLLVIAAVVGFSRLGITGANLDDTNVSAQLSSNNEAYVAYLRGLEFFEQRSTESLKLSLKYLRRATEIDPNFAEAHSALASAYAVAGGASIPKFLSRDEALPPALVAAQLALRLKPDLAEGHMALAAVLNALQPWSAANDVAVEHAYRRALALNPALPGARLFFGNFLSSRGRSDEALMQYRKALELDPLSASINSRLGMHLFAHGAREEGLDYLRKTVELNPWQFNARLRLGWAYVALDKIDAAAAEFVAAEQISPNSTRAQSGIAFTAARTGDIARARALLDGLLPRVATLDDPFDVAIIYVGLEDRDNAIEWLQRAARQTRTLHMVAPWGIHSRLYDWLRDDPRFVELVREIAATTNHGPSREQFL